jgi:hypothetical protein
VVGCGVPEGGKIVCGKNADGTDHDGHGNRRASAQET